MGHAAPTHAVPHSAAEFGRGDVVQHGGHDDHHPMHHVSPIWLLFAVWISLMFFTGVTVGLSDIDMGEWDIPVAMAIASAKALIVCLFFMHLLYDRPFNGVVFAASLLFVGIFIGITLLDSMQYQPEIEALKALSGN